MRFELFVALRYLFAMRKQAFISVISIFSVVGVCIGVASLIVTLGVMNGFTSELRDKILGVNAHLLVMHSSGALQNPAEASIKLRAVPGVVGVTPFIYSEVMASTPNGVKGLVLRGIDPSTAGQVLSLEKDMVQGALEDLGKPGAEGLPGIVIGQELASRLGIGVGDRLSLLSPSGMKSAAGFTPKIRFFSVVGAFKTGMYEYDSSLAYISLAAARDLLGMGDGLASGLEARLADVYAAQDVAKAADKALGGYPYYTRNWMEMNANLFAALKLEKTGLFVILVMIVLVGSFSIITTLVMLVIEKTRDIAVLMSMGARPAMIRRVFMLQGTIIGVVGTTLGYILGIGVSLALKKYQFIELPKGVYPMDKFPVRLDPVDLTLIGVAAMALCFLATLYPSAKAARLNPADALRYE